LEREKIHRILTMVLVDQLGRFYSAAKRENGNLFDYYKIDPSYASRMKQKVEMILGLKADDPILYLPTGHEFPNVYTFYSSKLEKVKSKAMGSTYFSYIHGDLNGANIIIDGHENVWLIDFFFTHYGHALKDFIKLENDLMYIWTPVENEKDLTEAIKITDSILKVRDLGLPLPPIEMTDIVEPEFKRTYNTIRFLRSLYPSIIGQDRNVLQLLIGQLWYSGRTLTYQESNKWQKLWALYTVGHVSKLLTERLESIGPLRIDWIEKDLTEPGRIGLTILPGRKDRGRSLTEDILVMKNEGVTHTLTLITKNEFHDYGVEDLLETYSESGFTTKYFPILDHSISSIPEMDEIVNWIVKVMDENGKLLIHCVGGLGRSGIVSASYLVSTGLSAQEAINAVRRVRSSKAIENKLQENFVRRYAAYKTSLIMEEEKTQLERFIDIIDFAIGEEKAAIEFYTQLSTIVVDPTIKKLLTSFADEENSHYERLMELKNTGIIANEDVNVDDLKSMVISDEEKIPFINIGPDMKYHEALELAMFKEKSAFKLYLKMAETAHDEEVRKLLRSLAMDEAKHKLHFEIQYEQTKV
jgi:protein-tyrosine phosphatase